MTVGDDELSFSFWRRHHHHPCLLMMLRRHCSACYSYSSSSSPIRTSDLSLGVDVFAVGVPSNDSDDAHVPFSCTAADDD